MAVLGKLAAPVPAHAQANFWELTSLALTSRVLALASSPRGFIFAGTDGQKVLRTSDGGLSWIDVGDPQLSPVIWSLEVDSLGTVFAGTEFRGVVRSTDDGASWLPTGLTEGRISCVFLTKGGTLLAGMWDEGIFRSTDGGALWTLVGAAGLRVRSIAETATGILVAAADTTPQEGRLYRSTDGGVNWSPIGLGLSSRVVYALTSVSAETLFAGTAAQRIYRSTNTGEFWASSSQPLPAIVSMLMEVEGEGLFAGLLEGGVLRSTDAGGTWFFETSGLLNLEVRSLELAHDGRVYAGTGEGVYRSARILTLAADQRAAIQPIGPELGAFPNPFNGEVTLFYTVVNAGPVRITAYDLQGRTMSVLEQNPHPAGSYHVRWVADNCASGLYLVVLETSEGSLARKVLLLR